MYFVGGYWEIDLQYGVDAGEFYAEDNAATPDLITATWYAWEGGGWVAKPSMTVSVDHSGSSGLCTPCSAAMYQPATASLACVQCPSGYTTPGAGSVSPDNCTACAAGKHSEQSSGTCQDCSRGQYQPFKEASSCSTCDRGRTTVSTTGSTNCTACPAGQHSQQGTGLCQDCSLGQYQPSQAASSCLLCPSGYTTPGAGSVSPDNCTACPAGICPTNVNTCS